MKHLRLLVALLALFTGGSNLFAQTDVTSTYLTNADFSESTAIDNHVCGYSADMSKNETTYCNMQPVDGWEFGVANGDTKGGAVFAYGSTPQLKGYNVAAPSAGPNGEEGNCLGLFAVWTGTVQYVQAVTLPAGKYKISIPVYSQSGTQVNKSLIGFIADNGTSYTASATPAVGNWVTETVEFTIATETTGKISLGYIAANVGSAASPMLFIDGVKIEYTDPLQGYKEDLQAEIDKAKLCDAKEGLADAIAAAEDALANATTAEELSAALAALQAADKDALLRYDNNLADASAQNGKATTFVVNGTFDSNVNGWSRTGGFQNNALASNQQGDFTVPFWENWNGSAKANKMYQVINNIPNGTYKLKIAAFVNTLADPNESQFVFANNDKTYLTTGAPTFYEVWTVVTDNKVEIGLEQTTATANWMGIDNVSLTYYGAGDVIEEAQVGAHKTNWEEALAAAQAAVANSDYANVTGEELAALNAEIAKAEPTSAEGYDAATEALRAATRAFTEAKAAYDALATAKAAGAVDLAYASTEKKEAVAAVINVEATNAADATTKAAAITTPLRAYYESHALAEGVEGAVNMTDKIANATNPTNNDSWTWTGNKNNPANKESWTDADGTNTHSYFDGGNWGANSWTTTMKQTVNIPAGKYLLTAKGRSAENTTLTMAVGEASVQLPHVGATGNVFDRGWGDASVEFETDGNPAEILVTASSNTLHEWFSISDFRLVQLAAIEVPMADADDYAALAAAIESAEEETLGFDEGEYAPYNNVAALQALAAAKAIDPEAEDGNTKEVVQNATAALKAATWTANTEEGNAVHNGLFATVQEGANYPEGWNRTNAWGQMQSGLEGDYATAYYNQPGSLKYGENGVYTMPLKENTAYVLNFAYRSHENNSNHGVTVSVLNGEEGLSNKVFEGNGSTTEWKNATVYFTTGAAGNYVLTLANNGNTWMTNVSIFKAKSVDITIKAGRQYTAFSSSVALDFSASELTAQIVTDENGTSQVVTKVPANTGVIVGLAAATAEAKTVSVPVCAGETDDVTANKLVAVVEKTTVQQTADGMMNYVFGKKNGKEAFYKVLSAGMEIPANNAYLSVPAAAGAKDMIEFGGDTNSINAVEAADLMKGDIFNLQGQKVNRAQKGVYIVNGKKIVVK